MAKRVKWVSLIKKADAIPYQPETPRIIKRDLISKAVLGLKERYRIINGQRVTVSPAVKEQKAVIKETVVRVGKPYVEEKPEKYEKMEFDCLVSELQDYGEKKYYHSAVGKIKVPRNAEYYEEDEE